MNIEVKGTNIQAPRQRIIASKRTFQRSHLRPSQVPYYIILSALSIFSLGPIVVLIFNAMKNQQEIGLNGLGLPSHWILSNFTTAWVQGRFSTTMVNSAILVAGTVIGVCTISGLAAYALAHMESSAKSLILAYLVAGSAVPIQIFIVPLFYLWSNLNLFDTRIGLIIIYCAIQSPFATLLLRSFMLPIPTDLINAARMDGANHLQILWRIIVPLTYPGFFVIALTSALATWNEFILATTFTINPDLFPVQTSLFAFHQQFFNNWALTDAAAVIALVPMAVIFLSFQRRFISGLATGAIRG